MIPALLITGILLGLCFGIGEGLVRNLRIRRNDPRPLPHGQLLTARITLTGLFTILVLTTGLVLDWPAPQGLHPFWLLVLHWLASFIALTLTHRLAFNLSTARPWYYMGSPTRTQDDSVYDDIMWTLGALLFIPFKWWHDSIPFFLAVALEGGVLWYTLHTIWP